MWNDTFGLNTILPDECYPLTGEITIIDIDTCKPELVGNFTLEKWSDVIFVKTDMSKYLANKNDVISYDSDIHVECIQMDASLYPKAYKYILTSSDNGDIEISNTHFDNVEIQGIGKVNSNIEISFRDNASSDIKLEIQPLWGEKKYCDIRVW